jgi:hypothetical protein
LDWIKSEKDYKHLERVYNGKKKDPILAEAIKIFLDKGKRVIINSFVFAKVPEDEMAVVLELELAVVKDYFRYIFRVEVLKSKLDKLAYINGLQREEKEAYLYSMNLGPDFIKWRICGESIPVKDVKTELRDLFSLAKYNTAVASFNDITGDQSKEALKWMSQATKLTDLLIKVGEKDSSNPGGGELESMTGEREVIGVLVGIRNNNDVGSITKFNEDEVG